MGVRKYEKPAFMPGSISQQAYIKWLRAKANAHIKRDRKRGNLEATREAYVSAIHQAVQASGGCDVYTGKPLRWDLIGSYDNSESKAGRRAYKKGLADLPTVDHLDDGLGVPRFAICSWQINGIKGDLSHDELLVACEALLRHAGRFHLS